MGLAKVRKPEGLVSCEEQSKVRSDVRFESTIQIGVTHKCDQQVQLTSAINRCDSQVRSTGTTHKCDRLNRESESLQVCKFEKARKFESPQVCAKKTQKIQKLFLNESGQFDNECSTINWCLRVVGTLRLII